MLANVARDLAQDGWCRCEGRAGADEALTFEHEVGHLPAVCARKPAARSRQILGIGTNRATTIPPQVIDLMVARDGIEPPTPAFSGLRSTPELPGHVSKPAVRRLRGRFASR